MIKRKTAMMWQFRQWRWKTVSDPPHLSYTMGNTEVLCSSFWKDDNWHIIKHCLLYNNIFFGKAYTDNSLSESRNTYSAGVCHQHENFPVHMYTPPAACKWNNTPIHASVLFSFGKIIGQTIKLFFIRFSKNSAKKWFSCTYYNRRLFTLLQSTRFNNESKLFWLDFNKSMHFFIIIITQHYSAATFAIHRKITILLN